MRSEGLIMNTQDKSNLDKTSQGIEAPNAQSSRSAGGIYEIRIRGQLNSSWSEYLEGMEMRLLDNGEMILFGPIVDQAALMGILTKLYRLNLTILSFNHSKKRNEEKMNTQTINRYFESIAWGALFVWWGILELVKGLPNGVGAIGIGLILLGLNVARALNRIPTSGFTTFLGLLALVWGGLELASVTIGLPFEISVLPVLLIVIGMFTLVRELTGNMSQKQQA
jgi:hypothetical protein